MSDALAAYIKDRTLASRNAAVEEWLWLARKIAGVRHASLPRCVELCDVESWAARGLMRAVQGFKPDKPGAASFARYAHRCIAGAIGDGLRDFDYVNRRTHWRGKAPRVGSLSEPVRETARGGKEFAEAIADAKTPDPTEAPTLRSLLAALCEGLNPVEVLVVRSMAGEMAQNAVARASGLHESRVSQIKKRLIAHLRSRYTVEDLIGGAA